MLEARTETGIVFYDGVCGLCQRWVRFLLQRDKAQTLRFAPLQGETIKQAPIGVKLAAGLSPESVGPDVGVTAELPSVIFVVRAGTPDEQIFTRSEAALRLLEHLGGIWRVVSWLRIIPRGVRDGIYDFIARRRYRWFGKDESCPLPPTEWQARFLP